MKRGVDPRRPALGSMDWFRKRLVASTEALSNGSLETAHRFQEVASLSAPVRIHARSSPPPHKQGQELQQATGDLLFILFDQPGSCFCRSHSKLSISTRGRMAGQLSKGLFHTPTSPSMGTRAFWAWHQREDAAPRVGLASLLLALVAYPSITPRRRLPRYRRNVGAGADCERFRLAWQSLRRA